MAKKYKRMQRLKTVEGLDLRRSFHGIWVGILGPHYVVHFVPTGRKWNARRPLGVESITTTDTLAEAVKIAKMHYQRKQDEVSERIASAFRMVPSRYL